MFFFESSYSDIGYAVCLEKGKTRRMYDLDNHPAYCVTVIIDTIAIDQCPTCTEWAFEMSSLDTHRLHDMKHIGPMQLQGEPHCAM